MLHLKSSHHFHLPHMPSLRTLQLSPVVDDDDEILQSLATDHEEDTLVLEDVPNVQALDTFWNGVEEDLKKDPTWFDFANE